MKAIISEVALTNTVWWDNDKHYAASVKITLTNHHFILRQVALRFSDGPSLDLTVADMDRLVAEWHRIRAERGGK